MFAFREWPIQAELRQLRAWAAQTRGPGYQDPGYGNPANYGYPPQ
jgi:hypothetical protein